MWFVHYQPFKTAGPHPMILEDLSNIDAALTSFRSAFDADPAVDAEQFFSTLAGANPRGITFLSGERLQAGIDPWGTPYEVYRSTDGWLIRSAGRDRVFNNVGLLGVDNRAVLKGNDDISIRIVGTRPIIAESGPGE
jgi:hypothetical protein